MIKITKKTEKIPVYDIEVEDNHNFFANGLCVHNCEIFLKQTPLDGVFGTPEIATCILSNINFGYAKEHEFEGIAEFLVNFLDNLIDVSEYSIPEAEYSAKNRRTLGIGISNLFGFLAKSKLFYNTKEARETVFHLTELFYYNILKASNELAKLKGPCELFNDTIYSDSQFVFERHNKPEFKLKQDWESLRKSIKEYGLRNSTTMAVPPAATSSLPSNATPGVEPPRELVTIHTDKHTSVKRLVPFYKTSKNYYTTAWGEDFNNLDYFKLISCIQYFVDQAISLNQYTDARKGKVKLETIIEELILSFNLGIKTWYYQNFRSTDDVDGISEKDTGCESGACSV